jgi:hypothetical protein
MVLRFGARAVTASSRGMVLNALVGSLENPVRVVHRSGPEAS